MKIGMNQTWNQHVVKKGNKSLVLDVIKQHSPISRATIASQTGLNKGTVSSLVSDLLNEELIYESGPGESSGGRRPVMLLYNNTAGHAIGIDLGVNYLRGIRTDLNGAISEEQVVHFNALTYEAIQTKLFLMIDALIANAPSSPYGIIGIGVGVPGTVDKLGKVLLAPNLNWENINLQSIIEKKYQCPVVVQNEANAGAYGEKKFGAGVHHQNIVYVSVAMGIGVGLILNGSLYKGHEGFSGELGHMTITANGDTCRCGGKGCWELYASEQALIQQAASLDMGVSDNAEHTLENLLDRAEQGNKQAIALFKQIGTSLGIGLSNIINAFNPELVVIGNRLSMAQKWIEPALHESIANQTLWFQQNHLNITFSKLTTHSTALGVAAFTIENFLTGSIQK